MAAIDQDYTQMKVDVGVLKVQVTQLTELCGKMDRVIDKLMENQEKLVSQIYEDIDDKKKETNTDIKELHSRITTISRELSDKVELTERRIMERIENLRTEISNHNKKEDAELGKILEWKWMVGGGILIISWLLSFVKFDNIVKLFSN
jgi:septal ring factor EnvC (AmiA/AmiB activator)